MVEDAAAERYECFVSYAHDNEARAIEYLKGVAQSGCSLATVRNKAGNNLLHHAVHSGMFEAVKFCVDSGVNPEQMNDSAKTPLDVADDYKKFRGVFRDIYDYLGSVSTGMAWVSPKQDEAGTDDARETAELPHHRPGFAAEKMASHARVFVFAQGARMEKKLELSFTSQWCPCALELEDMVFSAHVELRGSNGSHQIIPLAVNVAAEKRWTHTADGSPIEEAHDVTPESPTDRTVSDAGGPYKRPRLGGIGSYMFEQGVQTRGPRQCFSELDGVPTGRLAPNLTHRLLVPGCSSADPVVNDVYRLYTDMFSLGRDILIDSITSSSAGPVDFSDFRTIAIFGCDDGLPPGVLGSATLRVHKASAVLEILFMATRQDVKRRGLGRLLNARIKDIALSLGLPTIVVSSKQQRQEFWCKPSIGYTRANAAVVEQRVGKLVRFGETVVLQCEITPPAHGTSHAAVALSKLDMKPRNSAGNKATSRRVGAKCIPISRQLPPSETMATELGGSVEADFEEQRGISEKSRSIAGVDLGNVVWAKYASYPWWPGRITDATEVSRCLKYKCTEKEGFIWTYNFGSQDFSQVRAVHVRHFSVGVPIPEPHLLKKHGVKDLYEKAIKEAQDYEEQHKATQQNGRVAAMQPQNSSVEANQKQPRCGRCRTCEDPQLKQECLTFKSPTPPTSPTKVDNEGVVSTKGHDDLDRSSKELIDLAA